MPGSEGLLVKGSRNLKEWRETALNNADGIRRSRMLPVWVAVTFILFHFVLIGLCARYSRDLSPTGLALASILLYSCVLIAATITLLWSCKHYQVSAETLGIRPSNLRSDFQWSLKICALAAFAMAAAIVIGFVAALFLGVRLPAPPASYVRVLGGDWTDLR